MTVFQAIEGSQSVSKAQRALEKAIRRALPTTEVSTVGYQSGQRTDVRVVTDGSYWSWSGPHDHEEVAIPRWLNWFGRMAPGSLNITVEINADYEGRGRRISGFFARDPETGGVYLMHSGGVGGGMAGVGKRTFRAWHADPLVATADSTGRRRHGFIVMPVRGVSAFSSARRYIDSVATFKDMVRAGGLESADWRRQQKEFDEYFREASGRRTGSRPSEIDYVSRHGEVVEALKDWRVERGLPRGRRVVKSMLLDLGVAAGKRLSEVYEVKTSAGRAHVYTALGQVLVHGDTDGCGRTIVLPKGEPLARDIERALGRLRIDVLRYRLMADGTVSFG